MISRRSTLKAIAAAILAPTIHLRRDVIDERLMMDFCDPDAVRYDFAKPFGHGSLTYATDSRAMIRCELAGRIEDGTRRLPGNIDGVWEHWWKKPQWMPLTPDHLVPTEVINGSCPDCGDRRVSYGEHYPDSYELAQSLPSYDPDDNTIRDVSCTTCHGKEYKWHSCVRICGVLHSAWNLRRILALPNPHVSRSGHFNLASDKHGHVYSAILFRADGFEGISMGMEQTELSVGTQQ